MSSNGKKGRGSTPSVKKSSLSARRASAAIAAFLQLPAIFSSCTASAVETTSLYIKKSLTSVSGKLDIFFFDSEEPFLLDSYQQVDMGESPLYCMSAPEGKIIAALSSVDGDIYARSGITRLSDLSRESFSLEEDKPQNPFLAGKTSAREGASRTVFLKLEPLICTIRVRSVSADFRARPYSNLNCQLDKLYLINAVCECIPFGGDGPSPLSWVNLGMCTKESPMLCADGPGEVTPMRTYPGTELYSYPNPATEDSPGNPVTRLVLECRAGETKCYYPINLPGMEAGKCYELDITLLRMGTDSPDTPAVPGTYSIECNSLQWKDTEPLSLVY